MQKSVWNPVEKEDYHSVQRREIESQLQRQLSYAFAHSEFYKSKMGKHPIAKTTDEFPLAHLPFTEKHELLDDQTNNPPFGSNLCAPVLALSRVHKTSGTTGRPLLLTSTKNDIALTHEAGARCFWAAGLRPEHTVVHCLNFCMWAGGLTDNLSLEATGAQVIPFGVGNSRQLIETILLLKPQAIHCTPSYLSKLEMLIKDEFGLSPRDLGLSLGLFGAEGGLEDANFRKQIETTWGFKAMNANYGMSDALSMFGSECSEQNGLHFCGQDILHVELISPETRENVSIKKGAKGELVLTNLCKEAQPVIRYRSRDLIEILQTEPCSCGRRGFKFKIIGRADDMLVVKGINVFPGTIASVINSKLDVLTGEFVIEVSNQAPITRMRIRLETRDTIELPTIERALLKEFTVRLTFQPELELLPEGTLPRTEGKTRRVHHTL